MNIKMHSTTGMSFRGVAEYLCRVNNGGIESAENGIEWTETINLGTKDPLIAAKVMAATHYQQDTLKEQAGVSKRGRPSAGGPVMHYSIQWREDEVKGGVSKEVMMAEVRKTLAVLGKGTTQARGRHKPKNGGLKQFADEHQVFVIPHSDKKSPHVHVVVNRVHPGHGRMLSTSNDFLKLSEVASKFENKNGKIVSPEREINRQSRQNGNYVKAGKELPRKTWEATNRLAAGNEAKKKALLDQQRKKAAQLSQKRRDLQRRHREDFDKLEQRAKERARGLAAAKDQAIRDQRSKIVDQFLDQRREAFAQADADLREFEKREKTLLGRIKNRFDSIDLKALVRGDRSSLEDPRAKTIAEAFKVMGSAGARLEVLKGQHQQRQHAIARDEKKAVKTAIAGEKETYFGKMAEHRARFLQERSGLIFKQRGETAKTRTEWKAFDASREKQFKELPQKAASPELARGQEKTQEASPVKKRSVASEEGSGPPKTKPSDLTPKEGSEGAAKKIDRFREILDHAKKQADKEARHGKDRDDGRDR